jgi:hypothetical protein
VRASERPRDTARWLLEQELQAELLAEVEHERVVRLVPHEEGSPLATSSNAKLLAGYQRLCEQRYGGGDCLGLTEDGPVLDREDRRTLALAFALGGRVTPEVTCRCPYPPSWCWPSFSCWEVWRGLSRAPLVSHGNAR